MFPVFTTPATVAACSLITMDNVCVKQAVNGAQLRNNDLAIVELNFIIITWVQTSIVYCLGLTMTPYYPPDIVSTGSHGRKQNLMFLE